MEIRLMETSMAEPSPDSTYQTRDFYLAAALIAKGAHFLRVERQGAIGFFIFSDQERCARWTDGYFQGELKVAAKDMTNAIRSLKDALFAVKQHERPM